MTESRKSGPYAMQSARRACESEAVGRFTPIVLEKYEFIGGERGVLLGHPSETSEGRCCIVWTHLQNRCDERCVAHAAVVAA